MLTIRERNNKFQVQVRIKEGGVIVHQESATWDTRKKAELWGRKLEERLEKEGHEGRKQSKVTLGDLMDMHEVRLKKLDRDGRAFVSRFNNLRKSSLCDKSVTKLTSREIIDWAIEFAAGEQPVSLNGERRSPATVLNHLMAISALYNAAPTAYGVKADKGVIAQAIKYLKGEGVAAVSEERDRRVSDDEIARIAQFHSRQFNTSIPMPTIARFLIALPRRRNEIMMADWSDYDEGERTLTLRDTKHPTKVRNEVIPVPRAAAAILASLKRDTGRIFPYTPGSVSTAFMRVAAMLEIEDLHLHDLRHEGISRLFEAGLDIPEVALISGHTNWTTLKRYTHLKPKNVLEKLDNVSRQRAQETTAQS